MKYLAAVQGDPSSDHAFNFLLTLVKPETDEVYLLSVAEEAPMYAAGPYVNIEQVVAINLGLQDHLRNVVRGYGKQLTEKGIKHVCLLGKGVDSAGKSVCEEAEFYQVDVIVVGRRKLSGLQRAVSSSTSSYVLHNAHCSVLVVKYEDSKDEKEKQKAEEVSL